MNYIKAIAEEFSTIGQWKTSMNEFNDKEGFYFKKEEEDWQQLLESYLLTIDIRIKLKGADSIVTEPFIPSPDYSRIKELIDMLKSKKKPEEQSDDKRVLNSEYTNPDNTGRSLNMNS